MVKFLDMFLFFSSRRRHTRWTGDWSSDVCSSDLGAPGWIVENCEVRLNSGGGIVIGTGARVRGSNVHHNGQIGIGGQGKDILIENNRIWENNIHGFDFKWEAGGVKVVASDGVVFRGNQVHDNIGP